MSFPSPLDIAIGTASGWRNIKIEGRNTAVAQSFVPICPGGVFRTPQVGGEQALRIRAGGNAADDVAGAGARAVRLYGIDATGAEVSETIETAGASASAFSTTAFLRILDARVVSSGTYATQAAGSHYGDITIEDASGNLWAQIPINGFPEGRSRIGAFTIPANYEGFLHGVRVNADSGKTVDALVFQRPGILDTAPPYEPMTLITEQFNMTGFHDLGYSAPVYIPPLTDVGIMATVDVQTARVGVGLGLYLRRIA